MSVCRRPQVPSSLGWRFGSIAAHAPRRAIKLVARIFPKDHELICGAGSISPSMMIPEHRLAVLLSQVKQNQISKCLYHNPQKSPSLFADHICDRSQFPLQTIRELREDTGEVWFLEISHNGKLLATSGQGGNVTIYETGNFNIRYMFSDHTDHVPYLAWSPDDSKLITCSHDKRAKVWDVNVRSVLSNPFSVSNMQPRLVNVYLP